MNNWLQYITNSLADFGTSVTVRVVTISLDTTSYREPTESTSDSTATAFVQTLTLADDLVKEGIFRAGDLIFWFKGNQSGLTQGNRILHNSVYYAIDDIISHEVGATTYVIEARTRKI